MLEYRKGNMFDDGAEAIVNTVNCVGVMGRGIALQSKRLFPENFKEYEKACKAGLVMPGKMFVFQTGMIEYPRYIINFPTKRHWRQASFIEDIRAGLVDLMKVIEENDIQSVAIPPLGCGNGGLSWDDVNAMLRKAIAQLPSVAFHVYPPSDAVTAPVRPTGKAPSMTVGKAALLGLMQHYLDGLLDPVISLIEVQKLMYFLQEAGMDLRLNYVRHYYGPYAENLRHVLNQVEGYYINGYEDGGDAPTKILTLVPEAIVSAYKVLEEHPDIQALMSRVFALIDGFETPEGMELLATVHWTVVKEKRTRMDDIISYIYSWNKHKRQFSENQIKIAYTRLDQAGWLGI